MWNKNLEAVLRVVSEHPDYAFRRKTKSPRGVENQEQIPPDLASDECFLKHHGVVVRKKSIVEVKRRLKYDNRLLEMALNFFDQWLSPIVRLIGFLL